MIEFVLFKMIVFFSVIFCHCIISSNLLRFCAVLYPIFWLITVNM